MSNGAEKASDTKRLGPPSVRMVPPAEAERVFGRARAIPARELGPDETGRIAGAPRPG
jgi:hypothetical protein